MRHPPAVRMPCRGGAAWRGFPALLAAAAAGSAGAWGLRWLEAGSWGIVAGAIIAAVLAAAAAWWRAGRGDATLAWSGGAWSWAEASAPGLEIAAVAVEVHADLDGVVLLRALPADPGPAPRWLFARRADDPPAFRALCAALYAQHGSDRPEAGDGLDPGRAHRPR